MKKVSLPHIKLPKRGSVGIILIALAVAAILSASIVHFQNQKQAEARQAEKTRLAQEQHDKQAQAAIANNAELQQQVIQATSDKAAVCNYIVKLPKAKAVALPAQCK